MRRTIINNVATGQRNVDQFIDSRTVGVREEITLTYYEILCLSILYFYLFFFISIKEVACQKNKCFGSLMGTLGLAKKSLTLAEQTKQAEEFLLEYYKEMKRYA